MIPFTRRTAGNRRPRKFVLEWAATEAGGRLESRALTAPAFFARPSTIREVRATIEGSHLARTTNIAEFSVDNGATMTAFSMGAPNVTMVGEVTSTWVDNANPPPPAAPVGANAISGSTTSQIGGIYPGYTPGLLVNMITTAESERSYRLADSAPIPDSPVTLVESYTVDYLPSSGPTFLSNVDTTLITSSAPGGIGVIGNNTGITNVIINGGLPILIDAFGDSGVVATPTSIITWAADPLSLSVTITTQFPNGLPSTNGINPPVGLDWDVTQLNTHELWTIGNGGNGNPNGATGMTTLSPHYDASFEV